MSDQEKRALIYAAEEADALNHRHIGTAHLLLGLMREKEFASAEFLSRFGVTLGSLPKKVEALGEQSPFRARPPIAYHRTVTGPEVIAIHGMTRHVEELRRSVSNLKEFHWRRKHWKPHNVVMRQDEKKFSFDLTLAKKSSEFELVKGGWKKDQCAICCWELFESDDASRGLGFTNGRDWVCTECHERFIAGDFFSSTYSDIT